MWTANALILLSHWKTPLVLSGSQIVLTSTYSYKTVRHSGNRVPHSGNRGSRRRRGMAIKALALGKTPAWPLEVSPKADYGNRFVATTMNTRAIASI